MLQSIITCSTPVLSCLGVYVCVVNESLIYSFIVREVYVLLKYIEMLSNKQT